MRADRWREALLEAKRCEYKSILDRGLNFDHFHRDPIPVSSSYKCDSLVRCECHSMPVNHLRVLSGRSFDNLYWCFCEKESVFFYRGTAEALEIAYNLAKKWKKDLIDAAVDWEEDQLDGTC